MKSIGVDVGGTFTDFVTYEESTGEIQTFKLFSTPGAPETAVLEGLRRLGIDADMVIVHGSTVGTNAVLERKGARTAFVSTEGFKDLLVIGRQNRSQLYDLAASRPDPLIPSELSFELTERVDRNGEVLLPLKKSHLPPLLTRLSKERVDSVAICFLFSFLHPQHEQIVANEFREAGFSVSLSSEVLPEFREYERASTTALNAYVMPIMERYLGHLEEGFAPARLRIMNSNGGSLDAVQAREHPAKAILSGPAAGVVGAIQIAAAAGLDKIISFDMGGTSTDVSLAIGEPQLTSEGEIDGLPLRVPMIDIHTVGSGGGSIAHLDRAGHLHVGPQSAGADPGPLCYGRGGTEATVTDANLVLGRLDPEMFLGGEMRLDSVAPIAALEEIGGKLGMDVQEVSQGVIRIVNSHMAGAIRLVSVARGHDPRQFTLVSFGGAGGLHACDVAREVGIRRVLIPKGASTLSAYGMLAADIVRDYVQTVMLPGDTQLSDLEVHMKSLEQRGRRDIETQGIHKDQIQFVPELDLRYLGQSYELRLPFDQDYESDFHDRHREAYGYADVDRSVEIVNLRVRAVGRTRHPEPRPRASDSKRLDGALIRNENGRLATYAGDRLEPGNLVQGPALVLYPDTSVYLGHQDSAKVDGYSNLSVEVGSP